MPNNYEVIKSVPFDYGLIELRSDNIITFEPVDGFSTFTIPQLKVMLEILLDISEGIPRPYFSDNRNLKSLGTEERVYINEHMHKFTSAFAMTENSAITRFITHTFMQLNRPPFPVKMFKTKDEAILWLRTFNN
ncbi:MAG: hypothetical protein KDD29_06855 [Flavobacteriales bacterium]|nr:hypothetical protein [Flavobacteriales bacterium]MCB9334758.1 hypothetical protein [Flavobacteriales bacterium]